jgi:tellurite resistance protein TerC
LVFVGLVLALLFLDLFVFHRNAREVPFAEAMWLSGFWIAISLAFGGFVWFLAGADGAALGPLAQSRERLGEGFSPCS